MRIRSAVRRLLGDERSPRRVGQLSWRFLVDLAGVDAWTLSEELSATGTVADALASFTARRKPRTDWVRAWAHRRDRTRGLPAPVRDAALRLAGERLYKADYDPVLGEP